jgi:hypothetical protein
MRKPPAPAPKHPQATRTPAGHSSLVLIAAVTGGTLLTCFALCLGLAAVLSSANRTAQSTAEEETPPAEKQPQAPRPQPPRTVGFRKTAFTYRPRGEAARERRLLLWYPATGKDQPFDGRVRAALLLSPYTLPYSHGKTLGAVHTPVMLQGGTLDWGITPFLPEAYNLLSGPKYYLVLKNETHFGWTNLISLGKTTAECVKQGNARLITDYSLAFFRKHLRKEAAPLLQEQAEGLASYQFKAEPLR